MFYPIKYNGPLPSVNWSDDEILRWVEKHSKGVINPVVVIPLAYAVHPGQPDTAIIEYGKVKRTKSAHLPLIM